METENSKEIASCIRKAIENYSNIYADCTSLDIQLALKSVLKEY